jgi:type I restriction enzyme R subunit
MTPEQKARAGIDALLLAAGWHVCNVADANIDAAVGVAIREFPLNTGFGFADYLLYVNGKACGVIEAKKEGATPLPLICHFAPMAKRFQTVGKRSTTSPI